jgi:transcriptional regulator with XRE-family HTH domain
MPARSHATKRQVRLGTDLRRLREAAGLKAREVAELLNSTSAQISHDFLTGHLEAVRAELAEWEKVSRSTDFDQE